MVRLAGKSSKGGYIVLGTTKDIQAANLQAQFALFNPLKVPDKDNDSGNAFSYSSSNKKTKSYSDPLNILIGVLRKGNRWIETGYEKDLKIEQLLEEYQRMQKEVQEASLL